MEDTAHLKLGNELKHDGFGYYNRYAPKLVLNLIQYLSGAELLAQLLLFLLLYGLKRVA